MCRIDDCEPCTWFGTEYRKARKDHVCAECYRAITKGEVYAASSYISDGGFSTNKACAHCDASREWLNKHCGGWVTEGLMEELEEHFEEGYKEDRLARLIVGIKRKWVKFSGSGLMQIPTIPTEVR